MTQKRATAYANQTRVDPMKTRAELETLLQKHGARKFVFGSEPDRGFVMFEMNARVYVG